MEILDHKELMALAQMEGPAVSLYMPTHRAGREIRQDPIRLKNLVREAESNLADLGVRPATAREMLAPAGDLIDNGIFWRHQADGLAIFLTDDFSRIYRLPIPFEELVVVTQRFHIKPLLPLLAANGRYYVLALSQNQARLLECTRYSVREINLDNTSIPQSIEQALWHDDPERQLQFHTRTAAPPSAGGRRDAMFHGHGIVDDVKDDYRRYFNQIDHGLDDLLHNERPPLVLAGVDYLLPIYRDQNSYANLMEEGITGNPDGLKAEELQQQAWELVQPHFLAGTEQAIAQYKEILGTGLASGDLELVVPAAHQGCIGSLLVAVGVQRWGSFAADTGAIQLHQEPQPGDQDLLDLATVETLRNSGTVYALEPEQIPGESGIAALFRY